MRRVTRSRATWLLAGTGLVAAIALVAILLSSGADGVPKEESALPPLRRSCVAPRGGVAVRYPADWRATTHNGTPVPNPALCFTLRALRGPPSGRATVKLGEYLPPELARKDLRRRHSVTGEPLYPNRVAHVRLSMFQPSDNNWTLGKTLDFQDHGRLFFVGLVLRSRSSQQTRRSVEAVVDSIRVRRGGRCRPTSGVGSVPYDKRFARHLGRRVQPK